MRVQGTLRKSVAPGDLDQFCPDHPCISFWLLRHELEFREEGRRASKKGLAACAKVLGHTAAWPFQDQEGKLVVEHRMWGLRTVLSCLGQSAPAPSLVHRACFPQNTPSAKFLFATTPLSVQLLSEVYS